MTRTSQDRPLSVDPHRLRLTDDSGSQGVLVGQRCRQCQVCVFGPAVFCQCCSSADLESIELSKQGILFSFTVVRVPPAGWLGMGPYTLGEVELPEGPHVLAEIIGWDSSQLKIGMSVELALESVAVAKTGVKAGTESGKVLAVYKWRPQNQS